MGRPNSRSFIPLKRKLSEGEVVASLVRQGESFRSIAAMTGMSTTTAWRRYYFQAEWHSRPVGPDGRKSRRIPRQRATRARPSVRPRKLVIAARPRPAKPMSWLEVYDVKRCTRCREGYPGRLPCCPRCGG